MWNDRSACWIGRRRHFCRSWSRKSGTFDVIYLDPPYRLQLDGVPFAHAILARLSGSMLVAPSGHVLIQHFADLELPVAVRALALRVRKNYGGTSLSVYQRVVRGE